LNWEQIRARLRASEDALAGVLSCSPSRMRQVLRRRANELAQPRIPEQKPSHRLAVLSFLLGAERYGIELTELAEVLPYHGCTHVPGARPQCPGVVNLRGELRPVLELSGMLTGSAGAETGFLLIPRRGGSGLRVDAVEDVREIRLEELGGAAESRYVRGVAHGGLMLLDIKALLSAMASRREEEGKA
jgi:chemotaxis signal transduction protein